MTNATDEDLVRSLAMGTDEAMAPLMARHAARVEGYLSGRLPSREDVEEAVQDVFLRVHRGAGTFDGAAPFSPWLFAITRNVMRDRLRRARPAVLSLGEDPVADVSVYERNPARDEVRAAIDALPEKYRGALALKYVAGMSYREAARSSGLTEKGFETRLARARVRLRRALMARREKRDGV